MGSDGDILVSHGPSAVFSHKPAITYYNSYGNYRFQTASNSSSSTPSSPSSSSQRQRLKSPNRANGSRSTGSSERKPYRPCLVVRPDDSSSSSSSSDENESQSPIANRQKKKVVFADDRGYSLTQIRLMVETPLDKLVPIKAFANLHLNSSPTSESAKPSVHLWRILFNQPASNYLEFRKRLEESNVSLENVIVRSNENDLTGTVKVKNICFEKSVIVRSTNDDWNSHQDTNCSFVDNNTSSSVTIIYDTFSFKIPLCENDNVQFCVCFKSAQGEYWDNNDGKNYKLVKNDEQNAADADKNIKNVRDIINNGISHHAPVRSNTWPSYSQYNTTNINSYQGSVYW